MLIIDDLRFMIQISGADHLADAARHLNITPSAVTQRLKQVEKRAGVRLVDRSTRRIGLTSEGQLVVTRARTILSHLDNLSMDLDTRRDTVSGVLRIAAPLFFGRLYVAPVIFQFCQKYPDVKIELDLSERPNKLRHEKYDVIIHIGELPDSEMIVRKLAPNKRLLCAAPGYLAEDHLPKEPADLQNHNCIIVRENDEDVARWDFTRAGESFQIRIDPQVSCNDGEVIRTWVLNGLGIMVRSEWDIASELKSGRLIRLLPEFDLPDADVVALLGHKNGRVARTSAFLKELSSRLTPPPWRS
jgi:DNA-binding transcriptional LysR family regulator